jgi:tetratricopeptide (TPR) repeat protein
LGGLLKVAWPGQALLAAAESQGDQPAQAAAWNRIAAVQNRQGEYQQALRSVQRAERLARSGGATREVVLALFNRGVTLYRLGDSAAALEAGEQALAFNLSLHLAPAENSEEGEEGPAFILKDTGPLNTAALVARERGLEAEPEKQAEPDKQAGPEGKDHELSPGREATRETARILSLLAMINQRAGRYAQAESDYRQALKLQRARGDRPAMVTALNNLGTNAYHQGDYRAAAGYFHEAMLITRELGYYDLELVCLNHLAGAQVGLEDYAPAEAGLREVLRRVGSGSWFMQAEVYHNLAAALVGQKRCDEALAAGLQALDLARQGRSNENIGRAWRVLGRVASALEEMERQTGEPQRSVMVDGRQCSAQDCYAASLQVFVEMGAASEQARTVRGWAADELRSGDHAEGQRLWQEARDLFVRLGLVREVERMDQLAGAREEPR